MSLLNKTPPPVEEEQVQEPGLLSQEAPAEGTEAQPQEAQPVAERMPETELATKKYIAKAMRIVHTEKVSDQIVKHLKTPGINQVISVADLTVGILHKIDAGARKENEEHELSVKFGGALTAMHEIVTIGESAKLIDFTEDEVQTSLAIAIEKYLADEIASGRVNKERLRKSMGQAIKEMPDDVQEELHGRLGTINDTAVGIAIEQDPTINTGGMQDEPIR